MTSQISIDDIIKENLKRNRLLDSPYNPITGQGSLIPRKRVSYYDDGKFVSYLAPKTMYDLPVIQHLIEDKSIENFLKKRTGNFDYDSYVKFSEELFNLRLDHDFEFYCFTCVKIPDKSSDQIIPFKLNRSQRRLIARYDKMRIAGVPIRLILAKARQWGGSTATQIYMNWIQLRHRTNWNMAICTLVNAQAAHIRQMLDTTIDNFPPSIAKYTLLNYAGFSTVKQIDERGCLIGVGSTQAPDNLRTYNIHLFHASEVGSWEDLPKHSAKGLMQTLRGTIKNEPYTMIVLESTAKGVGNLFHREWSQSVEGKSGYENLFVPWFDIEMYREKIKDVRKFINILDEKYSDDGKTFWYLWELGATLEGINWYRNHKARENMDDISMFQEFPSNADEAFSSTGRPAFTHSHIKRMEANCEPPLWKGELVADDIKGKGAFVNLRFVESAHGNLWVWSMPDNTIKIKGRYCSFSDIGGKSKGADFSCTNVLDRYWMIEGGVPEVAAVWHGHIDQDLFAWKSAQLSYWYNKALWALEVNSLKEDNEDSEGDHFLTVLDEIADFYPNLYTRTNPEQIRQGLPVLWGYHTNRKTKPVLVDMLNAGLRDELYIEKDKRACIEMYTYELKENGTYGAKENCKDDHVIIKAGSLWLAIKHMPRPVEIIESGEIIRPKIVSEATI